MDFSAVNTVWVLVGAALVFFMQAGFCILESGLTRAKNAGNIIMKNLMDFCIGTPIFWIIGFGIMFGSSSAIFGGIDLFTRGDYSAVTPDGVPFTHSSFPDSVLCNSSNNRIRSNGRKNRFQSILHLQCNYFIDCLSGIWSLDMGRRLVIRIRLPRFRRFLCSTYGRRYGSSDWCRSIRTSYR